MAMQPVVPRPDVFCPACEGPLKRVGRMPVRRDTAQVGLVILSQPGDSSPAVGIDVYRCHDCGRLELYDHDFLLPAQ